MMVLSNPEDLSFRYYRNMLRWKDDFEEEFEGLLWNIHGANIIGDDRNVFYRPLLCHIKELAQAYDIKDVPVGFNLITSTEIRPDPDKRFGNLKQDVIQSVVDDNVKRLHGSLQFVARCIEKESLPNIQQMWEVDAFFRAPGITPYNEISKVPLHECFFSTHKETSDWVLDVNFVSDQCLSRVNSSQSSLLGLQKFMEYFRSSLDVEGFNRSDLVQFCLVADLLYMIVEFKRIGESSPDNIGPVVSQLNQLLLLATLGVYNVSF